jgi:hypothetical protein
MKRLFRYAQPWRSFYEGSDSTSTSPPPPPPPPPPPAVPDDEKPTLSQKQLNAALADDRRRHKEQVDKTVQQLEDLKKSKTISDKERDSLQSRITELNDSMLTKEQLADKEKRTILEKHKTELDTTSKDRDNWKGLFNKEMVTRSIQDEAIKSEAFNPNQIVQLLQVNSRLVEVLDANGSPVPGQYQTKVQMADTDKEGKPVVLDLTVPEAIKRMKERVDEFGNLFKSGVSGGLGQGGGGKSGTQKDPRSMTPEEYRKWRNTGIYNRKVKPT